MRRSMKRAVLGCVLGMVTLLGMATAASACSYDCVNVGPGFCRRCVDLGYYTGGTCQDSGQCGCFDTQNTCGLFALSGIKPAVQQASFRIAEPSQAPVCSADAPAETPPVR
jgi:hypothetical protein